MKLYFDIERRTLFHDLAGRREITRLEMKRGDGLKLEVILTDEGQLHTPDNLSGMIFCAKAGFASALPILLFCDDFAFANGGYTGDITQDAAEIENLLAAATESFVDLVAEVKIISAVGVISCKTVIFKIHADIVP